MESLRENAIDQKEISVAEGSSKYTFFADNDLLIAKVTPCFENGNISVAKNLKGGIGFGSSEIFVLRFDKRTNPRYMFYMAESAPFQAKACSTMCGVGGLKRISPLFMRTYEFNLPTLSEQEHIVAYLDKQLDSINERIWLRERELQTLIKLKQSEINSVVTRGLDSTVPMKDSGIPWIGQIPESWELKRVKDLCDFVSRGCTPDYVDDESAYMVMNQATFSKGYVDYSGVRYSSYCKKEAKINKGDLLIASTGGGVLGKVLLFTEDCEQFYADTHVTIVRSSSTPIIAKFLYYYFSTRFEMINALMAKGSTNQTELQRDELLSHFVPAPDIKEMEAICEHLDDRMTHFSSLIANVNAQIDKLKLLKKALINEVITGQRPIV
jgi:type I restriction enzyme S subunit